MSVIAAAAIAVVVVEGPWLGLTLTFPFPEREVRDRLLEDVPGLSSSIGASGSYGMMVPFFTSSDCEKVRDDTKDGSIHTQIKAPIHNYSSTLLFTVKYQL